MDQTTLQRRACRMDARDGSAKPAVVISRIQGRITAMKSCVFRETKLPGHCKSAWHIQKYSLQNDKARPGSSHKTDPTQNRSPDGRDILGPELWSRGDQGFRQGNFWTWRTSWSIRTGPHLKGSLANGKVGGTGP